MMKQKILFLLVLVLLAIPFSGTAEGEIHIAALKGPTAMGLSELMQHDDNGYTYQIEATADAVTAALIKGDIDIAMLPCNLASVLYNKTEGALQIAAINTLGVLYVVECGDSIQSVADLKGRTIYTTGQGTTPEFALRFILQGNGLDPDSDVTIEFLSEATEVASAVINDSAAVAVLPQPYVTGVLAQNASVRIALNLTEEWKTVDPDSALITGVCVVRRAFAEECAEELQVFMEAYSASVTYVNENPAEASVWIEELGIGKAAVLEKAIPMCNIVCITGAEMQADVSGYLNALYDQNPASVGGTLPSEDFYLIFD